VVDHLSWRRRVGEQVCKSYAESSRVAATALGGSVARGWADEFSDVEVFVFWDSEPIPEERRSAVVRSGGSIDVSWYEADAGESFRAAMQATRGRVGQLWPHEDDEWSEHFYLGDLNIGVSGFLVSTVDAWVGELIRGVPNDAAEMVAATLLAGAPMTGAPRLAAWSSALDPYPEVLALTVIDQWLEPDLRWSSIDQLAARDDRPAFDAVLIGMQQRLVRLLLAANGMYLMDPRPKWTRRLLAACAHQPSDCVQRLDVVQTSPPAEAASLLQGLFDETLDVLSRLFPTVDIEPARSAFGFRRAALSGPSRPGAGGGSRS
jgi:hypothetical protein